MKGLHVNACCSGVWVVASCLGSPFCPDRCGFWSGPEHHVDRGWDCPAVLWALWEQAAQAREAWAQPRVDIARSRGEDTTHSWPGLRPLWRTSARWDLFSLKHSLPVRDTGLARGGGGWVWSKMLGTFCCCWLGAAGPLVAGDGYAETTVVSWGSLWGSPLDKCAGRVLNLPTIQILRIHFMICFFSPLSDKGSCLNGNRNQMHRPVQNEEERWAWVGSKHGLLGSFRKLVSVSPVSLPGRAKGHITRWLTFHFLLTVAPVGRTELI